MNGAKPGMQTMQRLMLIAVGGVLVYGSIGKAMSPDAFAIAGSYLTGWSLETVRPIGLFLVVFEFLVGSALVIGTLVKPAALVAGIMLAGFLIPLAMLANDPLAPACGCLGGSGGFGASADANTIGLARNGILLLLLGVSMAPRLRRPASPDPKEIATI